MNFTLFLLKRPLLSIACLSGFFLASPVFAQEIKANPEAAKNKNSMCLGCHNIAGWRASYPETHKVPMIAGQNAKYIETALKAYRKGDRKHPTMRSVAESLTDQDIADLAAFYETAGREGVK